MDVPNEVRRELAIRAPRERVWAAFTQPDELVRWFPTKRAKIDAWRSGDALFEWEESMDEAVVDVVEPPSRLVFRWRPAGLVRPHTTVSFTLETPGGTRLTLVESGFASLPDQIAQQSQDGNDAGWAGELRELQAYLEAA
jgi:uncharacterized protein YndB with AHSA1/START domain